MYIRGGGGVAEVNEWRVRARTQGAGGALASSEVSLPAGTSSRVSQRERVPYTPKRGSGSHSCGLSPQPRPVPPASLLEPKVPGEPVFTPPHSHSQGSGPAGARSRRLALTWLSSSARLLCPRSVAQAADLPPRSTAPPSGHTFVSYPGPPPAALIQTASARHHWPLSTWQASSSCSSSPVLPSLGSPLRPPLCPCARAPASPMAQVPRLPPFSVDLAPRACPQTASPAKLL